MIWDRGQKGPFVIKRSWWILQRLDDITKRARVTTVESLVKTFDMHGTMVSGIS
jgi:hypothetical protein